MQIAGDRTAEASRSDGPASRNRRQQSEASEATKEATAEQSRNVFWLLMREPIVSVVLDHGPTGNQSPALPDHWKV